MSRPDEITIASDRDFSNLRLYLQSSSPFWSNIKVLKEHHDRNLLYVLKHDGLIKGYFALYKNVLSIDIEIFEVLKDYRLGSKMLNFIESSMGPNRLFLSLSSLLYSLPFWQAQGFQTYAQACYLFYPQTRQIQPNCTVTISQNQSSWTKSESDRERPIPWNTSAFEDSDGSLIFEKDYLQFHPLDDVIKISINNNIYYHGRIKYLAKTLFEENVKGFDHPESTGFVASGRHIFICQRIHGGNIAYRLGKIDMVIKSDMVINYNQQ